jgi:hypothetical protein
MTLVRFIPASEPGGAPAVLLKRETMTPRGGRRPVSMRVFVRDPELYRRLLSEASEGESLRVITETDWDALSEGDTLIDFRRLARAEPAAAAALGGGANS